MKGLTGKRWWSWLLLAAAVIVLHKLVDNIGEVWIWLGQLMKVLTPFIGGFVIAFLLHRPCDALERLFLKSRFRLLRRPARVWSILLVYLALLGLLAVMVAVVAPVVVQGVTGLVESLPAYFQQAKEFVERYSQGDDLLAALNLDELLQEAFGFVKQHLTVENIMGYLSGLVSITSSFLSVLITVIISVYMLAGRESLLQTLHRLGEAFLPERAVSLFEHYSGKTADIFSRYVYSMLLDALCIFVLMIPGLYISGIPYPLAFAVFIAVANLIPYFGAITSGSLSVLVLMLSGHWGAGLFLGIYVLVIQQLDGNVLQPRIYGQSVGIKPLYVLLAITVGGGVGGFVGMLIGVPVMAVLQMLVSDLIRHRNRIKRERAALANAAPVAEDEKE